LEKETVLGKELDELIFSLRPGIKLPSQKVEEDEEKPAAQASEAASAAQSDPDDNVEKEPSDQPPT
jgi:cell division protease FtsH